MEDFKEVIIDWKRYLQKGKLFIENEPLTENFEYYLKKDITSLYKMLLILWDWNNILRPNWIAH